MHYLIIRSPESLSETVTRFLNNNYQVHGFSVFDIEFLSPKIPVINDTHKFIFTSAYAVQSLAKFFTPTLSHQAFCVGGKTANYAEQAGFRNIFVPSVHHAEALFQLMMTHGVKDNLIYCTGIHRKPFLEKTLTAHNIAFNVMELYDAVAIKYLPTDKIDFLKNTRNLGIICLSYRNADILYQLCKQADIDKDIINTYQWHIVGEQDTMTLPIKHYSCYQTPEKLYKHFHV